MDSLGTHYLLDPEQIVAISKPVFQKMLNECSKARRDVHDYMQKDSEFTARIHRQFRFAPKEIIYNDAATIVYWTDGTKTVVKCNENDVYSEYFGFIAAVAKKMYGGTGPINQIIKSKKTIRGNGLGQPFRSKKTFEEVLNEAAEKAAKEYEELPPDPLEHPELHSR